MMARRVAVVSLALMFAFSASATRAAAAPVTAASATALQPGGLEAPPADETFSVGFLRVQRYGTRGRPLILVPGTESGSWAWKGQIERFRGRHEIYAVTLAGFDGVPPPTRRDDLLGQAIASLRQLIVSRHVDKPVLIGHSLGGALVTAFAQQHSNLIAGVIALDGLPVFPGMEGMTPAQRREVADKMADEVANATPEQFRKQEFSFMQPPCTIDPATDAALLPLMARSDQATVAEYMKQGVANDLRPGLKHIGVPLLEISPYYGPDFSGPPMKMTEAEKAAYYRLQLRGTPDARVVSISPARHCVMFDQPEKLDRAIEDFLARTP
jgi:pimeloyl-ACP methyl ester carboxylesterase